MPRPWRAPRTKRPSCHTPSSSRRSAPRPWPALPASRSPSYTLGLRVVPVARAAWGHGRQFRPSGSRWTPTSRVHLLTSTSGLRGSDRRRRRSDVTYLLARGTPVYQPRSPRSTRRRGRFPLVDQNSETRERSTSAPTAGARRRGDARRRTAPRDPVRSQPRRRVRRSRSGSPAGRRVTLGIGLARISSSNGPFPWGEPRWRAGEAAHARSGPRARTCDASSSCSQQARRVRARVQSRVRRGIHARRASPPAVSPRTKKRASCPLVQIPDARR